MKDLKDPARNGLARIMLWIASAALLVMMLITVADVLLRRAFDTAVRGAYDVVSTGLLVMVFFGLAPVVARATEISIDIIDALLSSRAVAFAKFLSTILALTVFLFLGWSMASPAQDAYRWGGYSLELGMPVWWQWVAAFVGLAGIIWIAVMRLIKEARSLSCRAQVPAAGEDKQ
ncbi:TRAP transporter small permease [Celeribacter sp. ULVN23_4]